MPELFKGKLGNSGAIVLLALVILSLSTLAAGMVASSIYAISSNADKLDNQRSLTAARGALGALKKQISATVRDNTFWDDAYAAMQGPKAIEWATSNWGDTTSDYPLYDTAFLINPDNSVAMAYHQGNEVENSGTFFDASLARLIEAARLPDPNREHIPVAFIKTRQGIALVSAAAIQPFRFSKDEDRSGLKVLVLSKSMSSGVVDDIRDNFNIAGLKIGTEPLPGMLHANLRNMEGRVIAYFSWPAENPGSRSFARETPRLVWIGGVFLVLLGFIVFAGWHSVTTAKAQERKARHEATHDVLTGLLNRAGLLECADMVLAGTPKFPVTLYLIDLDGFKAVNDAWGHPVGDRLLCEVSDRLTEKLPSTVFIARLGGDEFAILASLPDERQQAIAETILKTVSRPFFIEGRTMEIGCSVGIAQSSNEAATTRELMRRADLALYRGKELGRGVAIRFDASLDEKALQDSAMEQELRQALKQGDIDVVYQPLIDARNSSLCGLEALARWSSKVYGPVPPDRFIPVAEKSGLIDQLGLLVLEKAVVASREWDDIKLAVNVSPVQLKNPFLVQNFSAILKKHDFNPARLTVEVTEGVLLAGTEQIKRAFAGLRALGIKISLDDFGSGYASIGALREFGFDRMKIDRSLMSSVSEDREASAVLTATIALASALRMPVTAEGIENEMQASMATLSGCDELQGYLFSKPVPADEISSRYFAGRTRAA